MFYCKDCNVICWACRNEEHYLHNKKKIDLKTRPTEEFANWTRKVDKFMTKGTLSFKDKTPLELLEIQKVLEEGIEDV